MGGGGGGSRKVGQNPKEQLLSSWSLPLQQDLLAWICKGGSNFDWHYDVLFKRNYDVMIVETMHSSLYSASWKMSYYMSQYQTRHVDFIVWFCIRQWCYLSNWQIGLPTLKFSSVQTIVRYAHSHMDNITTFFIIFSPGQGNLKSADTPRPLVL